jgi:hypothetical protein
MIAKTSVNAIHPFSRAPETDTPGKLLYRKATREFSKMLIIELSAPFPHVSAGQQA